jgi:hypothetical protein
MYQAPGSKPSASSSSNGEAAEAPKVFVGGKSVAGSGNFADLPTAALPLRLSNGSQPNGDPATLKAELAAIDAKRAAAQSTTAQTPDVFPEPYDRRSAADYEAYARGWLQRALDEKWACEAASTRFTKEIAIRNALVPSFEMAQWRQFQQHVYSVLEQLQAPIE